MKALNWAGLAFGLVIVVLTVGYASEAPWAIATWPWPDLRALDYLLVSSFLAGAAAVVIWISLVGEWGALAGAAMNVGLMNAGGAIFLFQLHATLRAVVFVVFAGMNAVAIWWSLRHPIRDRRPVDRFLRGSFLVFWLVLAFATVQLFRRSPTIFPWTIEPDAEIMVAWLFCGSTVYFFWGWLRPSWHNARGQLLAFLAYDLVLLPRYLMLFRVVEPEHLPSLIAYVAVIVYSSGVAIYYLFINPKTRGWRIAS